MTAYYNEHDPKAAAWLRELIKQGHIAPGDVDERSILDVAPNDLRPYTQCHFFAGIGVWSYALRRAGWPDDRPVWTGSCPCQPFSAAGKGNGFDDERHLWPAWFHLIGERRPDELYGEQVASLDGLAWLDLVLSDMDVAGYAVGALDTCSAGVGSPNIRQRLYVNAKRVGHSVGARLEGWGQGLASTRGRDGGIRSVAAAGSAGGLADAEHAERRAERQAVGEAHGRDGPGRGGDTGGMADADNAERGPDSPGGYYGSGAYLRWKEEAGDDEGRSDAGGVDNSISDGRRERRGGHSGNVRQQFDATGRIDRPGPVNGIWRDADWLHCRDDYWRPVEPGTFPLAHGVAGRVGLLRGYGNAINAEVATAFIKATM